MPILQFELPCYRHAALLPLLFQTNLPGLITAAKAFVAGFAGMAAALGLYLYAAQFAVTAAHVVLAAGNAATYGLLSVLIGCHNQNPPSGSFTEKP